jgi:mannose-6-phosphate isomerase-like protein (cupin superfamily)
VDRMHRQIDAMGDRSHAAPWQTVRVADQPLTQAPDGSEIRELPRLANGSLAHCRLPAGAVTIPVRHRTIEEIWYVLVGRGEVWRGPDGEIVAVEPGTALTIPLGTSFQFRAHPDTDLELILTTMPPWPGDDEAVRVAGPWQPTVAAEPTR